MPLWPCQSDYPLRLLSTGQSVGYPEYESQSAPFGIPGTHGALTVVCMCVIQLKSSGLPISLVHVSRTTPPSKHGFMILCNQFWATSCNQVATNFHEFFVLVPFCTKFTDLCNVLYYYT